MSVTTSTNTHLQDTSADRAAPSYSRPPGGGYGFGAPAFEPEPARAPRKRWERTRDRERLAARQSVTEWLATTEPCDPPGHRSADLYDLYVSWCARRRANPASPEVWGRVLASCDFRARGYRGGRYRWLRAKPQAAANPGGSSYGSPYGSPYDPGPYGSSGGYGDGFGT